MPNYDICHRSKAAGISATTLKTVVSVRKKTADEQMELKATIVVTEIKKQLRINSLVKQLGNIAMV